MRRNLISIACLSLLGAGLAAAQDPSDRFYQAIRNNDLAALRGLVKTAGVNTKDTHETTPLMYAAAHGSMDAMQILVDAGADVNAKNAFDCTALMWAADDFNKARLLVQKGANVNARSKQGRTPLLIAAAHDGNSSTVKLLIEKGADISSADETKSTPLLEAANANDSESVLLLIRKGADVKARNLRGDNALMIAASCGNLEVMKVLLAKGVDVNLVDAAEGTRVKNGPIELGSFTALLYAVVNAGPDAVKMLLDAGSKVNVLDVRGMTPLMLAVGTDHPDARVIRLLLEKGADPAIKSKTGETAADWARKFNHPEVLAAFGIERKQTANAAALLPASSNKRPEPKEAAAKAIALVQRTSGSFFKEGGCVSCHAQNLSGVAVAVARANGIKVDEAAAAEELKGVKMFWVALEQILLQRMDLPAGVDIPAYSMLQFSAAGIPADRPIDAMLHNVVAQQGKDGAWHLMGGARPPMEDGDFSRTALCIRAMSTFGPPSRKAEFDERMRRAAAWLKAQNPRTTEDRNMQLLGEKWGRVDRGSLEDPLRKLMAMQREDGGWAQTPELASDAYATGTVLYTMHELGVPVTDAACRRGVEYLLRTQLSDGSWHVASRAPKFQPYFQSGFPHDHDQWISEAATAWSAIALTYAASEGPARAAK